MNSLVIFARRGVLALVLAIAAPVLAGAAAVLSSNAASAAVASSVTVTGYQRIDPETIKAYIVIKPGKTYGPADIDESLKILYGTGLFADVSIGQRGAVLYVAVVENPVINSVIFEGNKKIKSEILVQIVQLKPRGVLTEAKLQSDVNRIEEHYGRSGRSSARVEARVTDLGNNKVEVVFYIDEGDRTGVVSITFVGNDAYSSARLSRIVQTRKTNWLSWLNKRDIYSEEKVQADEELLRRFYFQHGYADFQVLSSEAFFDETTGDYHLTFTLDEGPKYTFGEVTIDSAIPGVDSASLTKFIKTKTGRTFNAAHVETTVEDLTIELSRMGFVFAVVTPRGDRDYVNHIIALTFAIDEGARAYVERIEIRGNTKTRDYVVRREFELSEGDAYNRVLVDKAERRLRNLDYFEAVAITTEPGSAPDRVVLVVYVKDKSTGSFSVAAGLSTSQGFIAEVAMEETNFLGRGQIVRIAVGGGQTDRTYNFSFTDPYFLGTKVSAGFDLYKLSSTPTTKRPFSTSVTGGGVRFGFPLTDALKAEVNYKISNRALGGIAACAPGVPTVTACYYIEDTAGSGTQTTLNSSAGYGLTYSTLDSVLDPSEGVYVKFSQDFAGIGGAARYMRTTADASFYRPVFPDSDIIGLVRVSGGNIVGLGKAVSVYDNFFKGGETIRGFAPFGYGPRDTTCAAGGTTGCGMALGGKNFWAATAEVQFPLPVVPPDFGLRGAVFADAGMLWGLDSGAFAGAGETFVTDTTLRSSVGGSILWASPFGHLRADYAFVLSSATYDNLQAFRIGAGTTF